jgi:hypothetical protein
MSSGYATHTRRGAHGGEEEAAEMDLLRSVTFVLESLYYRGRSGCELVVESEL